MVLQLLITILIGVYVFKKLKRKLYGRHILFQVTMFILSFFVLFQLVKIGTGVLSFLMESLFYIVILVAVIYGIKKVRERRQY